METIRPLPTNNLDITIVSLSSMDKLAVGDIFLFFADGYKYVILGKTDDGQFRYKRCEMRNKRVYTCHRNKGVFKMDADGGIIIANGSIYFDLETALLCATRL